MNTKPTIHSISLLASLCLAFLVGIGPAIGDTPFDCGSDGSYGAINITANTTLPMPADGIFRCTTINVATGTTLKFTPNSLNTPVYLLAQGDVTIAGTIDVGGQTGTSALGGAGGPGGFAGGTPGISTVAAGDGHGPGKGLAGTSQVYDGAAHPGHGAFGGGASGGTKGNGAVYGSLFLIPLAGGSGGGGRPSMGGGGGGGAVLIASNTQINLAGSVASRGGGVVNSYWDGGGSGGAVRLLAPSVTGSGSVDVSGVTISNNYSQVSGPGRIRVDCGNMRNVSLSFSPSGCASLGSNMIVTLPNSPRLDITQAAGNNIQVGTNGAVSFLLPLGTSPNQTVTIQASNFAAVVPIRLVLTPDNGSSVTYDSQIDNTAAGSASVTIPVVVPVNVQVHVEAWTR